MYVRFAIAMVAVVCASIGPWAGDAQAAPPDSDVIFAQLKARDAASIREAVESVRAMLASDPGRAVDRLNERWLAALLQAKQYETVLEFSAAGTLVLPADTWRVEQLQRHRIRALLELNRPKEALAAARGLYNVAGIGFTREAMELVAECLKAAHPEDPGIANRFKLQQLAGAKTDPREREKAMKEKDLGEPILAGITPDPTPWQKAIEDRRGNEEYRALYGTGNLLLLAGRAKEAREVFEKVLAIAPTGEVPYASEGLAAAIKAEAACIGPANAWIASIRPR